MVCSNAVADPKQIHSIKSGCMSKVWPSSIEFPGRHSRSTETHGSVSTKHTGFAKYQEVVGADVYVTSNHMSGLDQILTSGIPRGSFKPNGETAMSHCCQMSECSRCNCLRCYPLRNPGTTGDDQCEDSYRLVTSGHSAASKSHAC